MGRGCELFSGNDKENRVIKCEDVSDLHALIRPTEGGRMNKYKDALIDQLSTYSNRSFGGHFARKYRYIRRVAAWKHSDGAPVSD
jgi:hypothetical protein